MITDPRLGWGDRIGGADPTDLPVTECGHGVNHDEATPPWLGIAP
jgi:hypothetical protein